LSFSPKGLSFSFSDGRWLRFFSLVLMLC
jgi:hypothetical protein